MNEAVFVRKDSFGVGFSMEGWRVHVFETRFASRDIHGWIFDAGVSLVAIGLSRLVETQ